MRTGIMGINYKCASKTCEKIMASTTNIKKYSGVLDFFTKKNIKLMNDDYLKIFEKVINNKNVFVFLDPPYLVSFNKSYNDNGREVGGVYLDILEFLKVAKCKILFIINKNALTSYIFKGFIKGEYDKKYDASHQNVIHLIITNY